MKKQFVFMNPVVLATVVSCCVVLPTSVLCFHFLGYKLSYSDFSSVLCKFNSGKLCKVKMGKLFTDSNFQRFSIYMRKTEM